MTYEFQKKLGWPVVVGWCSKHVTTGTTSHGEDGRRSH